jgi:uncharacterized protein (TIGR03435 family)
MDRTLRCVGLLLLLSEATFGQAAFERADVHAVPYSVNAELEGDVFRGGRYELRAATMLDMIRIAYGIDAGLVFGGPGWLDLDRFTVLAEAPPSTPPDSIKPMLQSLLAERFKLMVHKDVRPTAGFVLKMGAGQAKLKISSGPEDTGCRQQALPRSDSFPISGHAISCHNTTMEALASGLRAPAEDYLSGPVVDRTDIQGSWDFELQWTGKKALGLGGVDGITLFDAIDKQLGLKLEPQTVPMAGIVVDRVNQKPTANPQGVTKTLPPPQFEVASLKPALPGAPRGRSGFFPGGRVEMRGLPLTFMIRVAWNLDLGDAQFQGAPKWLGPFEPAFDLFAKAPLSSTIDGAKLYYDDYRLMLRALLIDRFKMVTHYENRPLHAYSLVGAKPKLKPADRANRGGCKAARSQAPRDLAGGPVPLVVTCKNIAMAEFAERLQAIAPAYLDYPVRDASGIAGAWDFTFSFSPAPPDQPAAEAADGRSGARTRGAPAGGETNGITLFEALGKQLGLKLVMRKRIERVLVIDHIERKPADN